MKKWKLTWGLPTGFELGVLIFAVLCLIIFDYAQNLFQPTSIGSPSHWYASTLLGLSALTTFWIFFGLYNLSLFIVYGRSLRQRLTSYRWDMIFGITTFFGIILLLAGGIGALYFSATEPLPYMFFLNQIDVYHAGISLQWIGILYFTLTS